MFSALLLEQRSVSRYSNLLRIIGDTVRARATSVSNMRLWESRRSPTQVRGCMRSLESPTQQCCSLLWTHPLSELRFLACLPTVLEVQQWANGPGLSTYVGTTTKLSSLRS